jgi:hypothetical protein
MRLRKKSTKKLAPRLSVAVVLKSWSQILLTRSDTRRGASFFVDFVNKASSVKPSYTTLHA